MNYNERIEELNKRRNNAFEREDMKEVGKIDAVLWEIEKLRQEAIEEVKELIDNNIMDDVYQIINYLIKKWNIKQEELK